MSLTSLMQSAMQIATLQNVDGTSETADIVLQAAQSTCSPTMCATLSALISPVCSITTSAVGAPWGVLKKTYIPVPASPSAT